MKWDFNNLAKTRFVWHLTIVTILLLSLVAAVFIAKGTNTVSADDLIVNRQLPTTVARGGTFDVTITLDAPQNDFQVVVIDQAPTSPSLWTATANKKWCTPVAGDAAVHTETINQPEYAWYDSFSAFTPFTVVYEVNVPSNATLSNYNFGVGDVGYKIAGGTTNHVGIGGDSQVQVVVLPTVTTSSVNGITTSTATLNGNLTSTGGYNPVNVSFEWGTVANALDHETNPQQKSSTGSFSASLSTLTIDTTYYFRAKVTTLDNKVSYGPRLSFTTIVATLSGTPSAFTNSTTTDITVSGTGVIKYKYSFNGSAYSLLAIGKLTHIALNSLPDGSYTLSVIGGDAADNWQSEGSATVATWTVDTIAPVVTGLSNDSTPKKSKTWSWSSETGATFRYVIDQSATGAPTGAYSSIATATQATGNGTYYIHVQVRDIAANESTVYSASVILDNIAPTVTGLSNDSTPTKSKTWTWSSEAGATFRYAIDQSATWTPTGAYSSITTATQSTGNGTYYIHVQARDIAGNESTVYTASAILKNLAITTSSATGIGTHTATLNGNISSLGNYTTVGVSFKYGTVPGVLDQTISAGSKDSEGNFSADLSGLTSNKTYYFKAVAEAVVDGIPAETVYGDELNFTTEKVPPTVTTLGASDITASTATLHSNLASLGDYSTVNVSIIWGTVSGALENETGAQSKTLAPIDFSDSLSGLTLNTRYYFRAMAVADEVTVYGDELSFATIDVNRQLPVKVIRGKTFEVTITFTTTVNLFDQIVVVDQAPNGWTVAVDKSKCTPAPNEAKVALETPNMAEYSWTGSYNAGIQFTVVYQVTVPADAPLESYTFANGLVYFTIDSGATCVGVIGGNTQTEVIPGSTIQGKTYQVNGAILPNVTIELFKDGVGPIMTSVSDSEGNYTIIATQSGNHTLLARKSGFKDEAHEISVAVLGQDYALNFKGNQGIVPSAPNVWYVLDCAALWKYKPLDPELGLNIWKVLDVAAAWKYPNK